MNAPHLYRSLRAFCLGAFAVFTAELEDGAELPFAFEEHVQRHGPALYELRPLVRAFIDERASVKDMEQLTRVYRGILDRYFA